MIPEDFLKDIATSHSVSDREWKVLFPSFEGKSTKAIAQDLNISEELVRKRLSDVYKKFHITGRGPIKLAKLQKLLVTKYQASVEKPEKNCQTQDWGEAPNISVFYGRKAELATLSEWILEDKCRLVALLGMGGIGKTTTAVKLAQQIQNQFDFIIWRSFYSSCSKLSSDNQQLPQEFLADLLGFFSKQQETELPQDINDKILLLLEYLRQYRCLIVLDNLESVLRSGDRFGRYEPGYENYGLLLRRVGESQHQSCLLLCSQEKPREISLLESPKGVVQSLQLEGLKEKEARNFLKEQGLTGEKHWEDLIQCAKGNPFALKIISATIKDLFHGNVTEFTQHNTWVFGDYLTILDEQWNRLSNLEKRIMQFLASEIKSVSLAKLKEDSPNISTSEIIETLASLKRRGLIKTSYKHHGNSETIYSVDYLIQKYIGKYHLRPVEKVISNE